MGCVYETTTSCRYHEIIFQPQVLLGLVDQPVCFGDERKGVFLAFACPATIF